MDSLSSNGSLHIKPDEKQICEYCTKEFNLNSELHRHIRTHPVPHVCSNCGEGFVSEIALIVHTFNHEVWVGDTLISCRYCGKGFSSLLNLSNHIIVHTRATRMKIEENVHTSSPEKIDEPKYLRIQMGKKTSKDGNTSIHTTKRTSRTHSDKSTRSPESLEDTQCFGGPVRDKALNKYAPHLNGHAGTGQQDQKPPCPSSEDHWLLVRDDQHPETQNHTQRVRSRGANQPTHSVGSTSQETNRRQSTYELFCPHCDQLFLDVTKFNEHVGTHAIVIPPCCCYCDKVFSDEATLRAHLYARAHGPPHICPQCCKGFQHQSSLRAHMYTHTGRKPFVCPHCGEGFNRAIILKYHLQKHVEATVKTDSDGAETAKGAYICSRCDKSYRTQELLERHQPEHAESKECPHCGRGFRNETSLRVHIKSKENTPSVFHCPKCRVKFCFLSSLKKHMLHHHSTLDVAQEVYIGPNFSEKSQQFTEFQTHLNTCGQDGSQACPICEKTFTEKQAFKKHMSSHVKQVKRHECAQCGLRFRRYRYLTKHTRTHLICTHREDVAFRDCRLCIRGFDTQAELELHLSSVRKSVKVHRHDKSKYK